MSVRKVMLRYLLTCSSCDKLAHTRIHTYIRTRTNLFVCFNLLPLSSAFLRSLSFSHSFLPVPLLLFLFYSCTRTWTHKLDVHPHHQYDHSHKSIITCRKKAARPSSKAPCIGCENCEEGQGRRGVLLSDSTYVLLMIDGQLATGMTHAAAATSRLLTAHEMLIDTTAKKGKQTNLLSSQSVCDEALRLVGLSHLSVQVAGGKEGQVPCRDGRHVAGYSVTSCTHLPPDLLDAALDASFAEGQLTIAADVRRLAPHLPARVEVDEITLAMLAMAK
mmetsp:Transcript_6386/g.9481  ORF Transcript_6386/g.9481 Transcript_6386/m.9481 type:complete len:275 (+) Transcript_6386:376-1200(+)